MENKKNSAWKIVAISLVVVTAVLASMYFFKISKQSKKTSHHHGDGKYHAH